MKQSLQKLQRFFKLEAERGYDNRAVVGGLDRMLEMWEAEARAEGVMEEIIEAVKARIRDYPRLAANSRAEVLEGLWKRIQRSENLPAAPLGGPARPPTAPAAPTPPLPSKKETQPRVPKETQNPSEREKRPSLAEPVQEEDLKVSAQESSGRKGKSQPNVYREEVPPAESNDSGPLPDEDDDEPVTRPWQTGARYLTPTAPNAAPPAALNAPTTVLPGVGPRYAQTLERLDIRTLGDMLYYLPRRYDDYSQLKAINRLFYGDVVTVIGTIQNISIRPIKSGKVTVVEAVVSDGTGAMRITWFNRVHLLKRYQTGMHVVLTGKIEQYLGRLVMNNPDIEQMEPGQLEAKGIVPVYPLTANISQGWLRRLMYQVVTHLAPRLPDPLPLDLRRAAGLMDLSQALLQAHFPKSQEELKAARHRLAFDEIFLLQLGVLNQKRVWQDRSARRFVAEPEWMEERLAGLPFSLTDAQQRTLADLQADLASGRPMNRLIQGDVGSGKTVVAGLAAAIILREGAQVAIMAPTGILAEQHYKSMIRLLAEGEHPLLPPEAIRLMVGATPESEKREIRAGLEDGSIKLILGTHALIEDPVTFTDLQLAIVDEQHRFGVEQRAALRAKGQNPHLLVMTATPIPRSLALTVYGDLDLSVMDEMPAGRQPVGTYVVMPLERERAYSLIRAQVDAGRQVFIIYPLVEESEKSEARAAVEEYARLQSEIFPKYRLGLLHGRMKPEEKDEVMSRFRDQELHILVSTSVIEVGVDVPNATVMLIEGANRFGLAQLHQFRGRVGRGAEKSYCLLIPDTSDAVENERLKVMAETNDGFVLAERDLDQRGPGQFLGTRQSGFSDLQLASLTDVRLIEKARTQAQALFEKDPDLTLPTHQALALAMQRFWNQGRSDIS